MDHHRAPQDIAFNGWKLGLGQVLSLPGVNSGSGNSQMTLGSTPSDQLYAPYQRFGIFGGETSLERMCRQSIDKLSVAMSERCTYRCITSRGIVTHFTPFH